MSRKIYLLPLKFIVATAEHDLNMFRYKHSLTTFAFLFPLTNRS